MATYSASFKKEVYRFVNEYRRPNDLLAAWIVVSTVGFYASVLAVVYWLLLPTTGPRLGWVAQFSGIGLCALIIGGLYLRTFMIHHDLAHGSFFSKPRLNQFLAPVFGVLCNVSPTAWSHEHNYHHIHSNNLAKNQDGQTAAWTVEQFKAAPRAQRLLYYLANQPLILYSIVPFVYFFVFMRFKGSALEFVLQIAFYWLLFEVGLLWFFVITFCLIAIFGFSLFHLQHTFDGIYKAEEKDYDFFTNCLEGSSYWQLPEWGWLTRVFEYFLFNVQYHHIHHLNPLVAGYNLKHCHEAAKEFGYFQNAATVSYTQALKTLNYGLYDTTTGTFRRLKDFRRSLFSG